MTSLDHPGTIQMSEKSPTCASSAVGLDADPVVNCVLKALLTAKVFLGRLDGDVAQQKLDLVQFPSGIAAQAGAGPTQVMRGKILDGRSFGAVFHDMPDYPLRYSVSPSLTRSANAPEHAAFPHAGGGKPRIDRALNPSPERAPCECALPCPPNRRWPSDLPVVAGERHPVQRPFPPQAASQENAEERSISFTFERGGIGHLPARLA